MLSVFALRGRSLFAEDAKECLDCHPDYYEKLQGKVNHAPFEQRDCYACHRFHGFRNDTELIGTIEEVCAFCHDEITGMDESFVHAPILDEDGCLNCHRPHSSKFEALLLVPKKQVCIECHDAPDDNAAFIHAPYADTACTECHNPHGSSFGTFYTMPIEYVCLGCHADMFEGMEPSELHAATPEKNCDQCHVGHSSANKALLRQKTESLCLDCHGTLKEKLDAGVRHTILDDDDCLVCHRPHFQKGGSNLVAEGQMLCFSCHDDIERKLQEKVVHAAVDNNCTDCHDPHLQMKRSDEPELCSSCHEYKDDAFIAAHLGLTPHTCSECHDPHGSPEDNLIRPDGHAPFIEGECDLCHDSSHPGRLRQNDLCFDCHEFDSDITGHKNIDLTQKKCIACHSPHGPQIVESADQMQ